MRRITIDELKPGMRLALPIRCHLSYNTLLSAGTVISKKHILHLREIDPGGIYIETPEFDKHPGKKLYYNAVTTMDQIFENLFTKNRADMSSVKDVVENIAAHLGREQHILMQLARLNNADSYSVSHCVNVCIYALFLGHKFHFKESVLKILGTGAMLHDIGKLKIPRNILRKPASLTPEEYMVIKRHPLIGYHLLANTAVSREVKEIVCQHHENCDGSGYPFGKIGEEINDLAKIVSIADVYDAVTTDRAYRPKMLPHEGMEILVASSSANKLDYRYVSVFMHEICMYPIGTVVRLNTGEVGKVVGSSRNFPSRPRVAVKQNTSIKVINLIKEPTIFISEIISMS